MILGNEKVNNNIHKIIIDNYLDLEEIEEQIYIKTKFSRDYRINVYNIDSI